MDKSCAYSTKVLKYGSGPINSIGHSAWGKNIGTKGSVIESSCEAYAEPMTKGAVESTGSDYCGQKVERAFAGGTLAS